MNDRYRDILGHARPISRTRRPMSLDNRAAQFAPFAALTGHDAHIRESGRLTDAYIEPDENAVELLNRKLRRIAEHMARRPCVKVICFQPDARKSGGAYVRFVNRLSAIDEAGRCLRFADGRRIPLQYLYDIREIAK